MEDNNIKKREKIFNCPFCEGKYTTLYGLGFHKKTKHNFYQNKKRGRPRKSNGFINEEIKYIVKYKSFFNKKNRKNKNNDIINLNKIKESLLKLFSDHKNEFFLKLDKIENYAFYKLIINNWEKDDPDLEKECLREINNINTSNTIKTINLDGLFFKYLKEVSKKSNYNYFSFIIKFIVILREYINELKKNFVSEDIKDDQKAYYSQIYNAEAVPLICNDFYIYISKYNYFDLDKKEFVEILQHFCYWLYINRYSEYHLTN